MKKRLHTHGESSHRDASEAKKRGGGRFFSGTVMMVMAFAAFYLYSTNGIAVQGYAIRSVEKDIAELKQENNRLRIQEAELKSLYRIEEAGKRLNMFEPIQVSYMEESSPIALR